PTRHFDPWLVEKITGPHVQTLEEYGAVAAHSERMEHVVMQRHRQRMISGQSARRDFHPASPDLARAPHVVHVDARIVNTLDEQMQISGRVSAGDGRPIGGGACNYCPRRPAGQTGWPRR